MPSLVTLNCYNKPHSRLNDRQKIAKFLTRVVFVQAMNECIMYVCVMNASEMYRRCNILKERP